MPSGRTNNFPESGLGLGHVTLQFLAVRSAILATAWLLIHVVSLRVINKIPAAVEHHLHRLLMLVLLMLMMMWVTFV